MNPLVLFLFACLALAEQGAGVADAQRVLRQAVSDLQAERLAAAEEKLRLVLRETPDSPDALYYLGVVQFRLRSFASARQALERAVRLAPSRAAAWKALGAVHAAEKNYRLAEEPFRKACELDPGEPDACYYVGRNSYSMNRFEPAVAAFEKALTVEPQRWRVHNGMALALEALGREADAEQHYRKAVEGHKGQGRPDEHPGIDLGAFLYKQGRVEEALATLEPLVAAAPGSPRARFELARALVKKNRLEPAAGHLEKAVALDPSHWAAHVLLGRVYHRLGRAADGERHTRLGETGLAAGPPVP